MQVRTDSNRSRPENDSAWVSIKEPPSNISAPAPSSRAGMAVREAVEGEQGVDGRIAGKWTDLRCFVSSTFVDQHGERDALVKRIMPSLNERLRREDRWVRVTPIDLRWGVLPDQVSRIQQTCLNEIDTCVSPPAVERAALQGRGSDVGRPWIVALRGERYGWVQEQYAPPDDFTRAARVRQWASGLRGKKVSITSMEVLHAVLAFSSQVDAGLPPQADPATGLVHAFAYFRDPTFKAGLPEDCRWVFDFDYIQKGAEDRLPSGTSQQYTAVDNCSQLQSDLDEINRQLQQATDVVVCRNYAPSGAKVEITGQLPSGKKFGVGTCLGLQEFESMVSQDLYAAMAAEFPPLVTRLDPAALERVMHETVLDARASSCFGRADFLADLVQYMLERGSDEDAGRAGVVWGDPGAGYVFVHVVSATAGSFRVRDLLSRLCGDLISHFGLLMEVEEGLSELRFQLPEVLSEVSRRGAGSDPRFRLCILIDAVNQMSPEGGAYTLNWLPLQALPPAVSIMMSTLPHTVLDNVRVAKGNSKPREFHVPALEQSSREQLVEAFLAKHNKRLSRDPDDKLLGSQMDLLLGKRSGASPLYLLAACEVLVIFGGVYERMSAFISEIEQDVPSLFVQLLGLLEHEHSEALVCKTMSLVACSPSGLMEMEMIELLEGGWSSDADDHPGAHSSDVAAAQSNFSRLYACSKMFLSGSAGAGMLQFFHDQLLFAVRSRYDLLPPKLSNKTLCNIHLILGNFFWTKLARPSSPSYEHAVSVCPQHLLHAGPAGWPRLCRLLPSLAFIQARAKLHMLPFLTQELVTSARVLRVCTPRGGGGGHIEFQDMGAGNPKDTDDDPASIAAGEGSEVVWDGAADGARRLVEAIAFVRKEGANLSTWPRLTVQIALNQRDGSLPNSAARDVLAAHEREQDAANDAADSGRDGNLEAQLERRWGEGVPMGIEVASRLLRQVRKEEGASDVVSVLKGHTHYVVDLDFGGEHDGLVVSASTDSTLKVWEVETGAEKAVLRGHRGPVTACMFFGDGQFVVSGGEDGTVRGWDAGTGFELSVVGLTSDGEGAGGVSGVRCIAEEGWVAASCLSGTVALLQTWQLKGEQGQAAGGSVLAPTILHQDHNDPVLACDLFRPQTESGGSPVELAAWGLKSGVLVIWQIDKEQEHHGTEMGTTNLGAVVSAVAFVKGVGQGLIAAGTHGHKVHIVSYPAMVALQSLGGFGWVYRLRSSPSGLHLLLGSRSKQPVLLGAFCDLDDESDPTAWQWEEAGRLIWHQSFVTAVAFSEGGAYWATGSEDRAIVLWKNGKSGADIPTSSQGQTKYGGELISHPEQCTRIFVLQEPERTASVAQDGGRVRQCLVVSFSSGKRVTVHDASTGKELWRQSYGGAANGTVPFAYLLPQKDEEEDASQSEDEDEADSRGVVVRLGWGMVGGALLLMDIYVDCQADDEQVDTLQARKFDSVCSANTAAVGRAWVGGDAEWSDVLVCGDENGALTLSRVDEEAFDVVPLFGMGEGERVGHSQGCRVSCIEAVEAGGDRHLLGTFVTGGDDDCVRVWRASGLGGQCTIDEICVIEGHRNLVTRVLSWWAPDVHNDTEIGGDAEEHVPCRHLAVVSCSMDRRVRLALVAGWVAEGQPERGQVVWVDEGVTHKDGVTDMATVVHQGQRLLATSSLEGLVSVRTVSLLDDTQRDPSSAAARAGEGRFGVELCAISSVSAVTSCALSVDEGLAGQGDEELRNKLLGMRLVLGLKSGEVLVHVL